MKNSKIMKIVTFSTIIFVLISFISICLNILIPMYVSYKFDKEVNDSNSTAIIGGADGPTSIFIASNNNGYVFTIIFALLSLAGVIFIIYTKKYN